MTTILAIEDEAAILENILSILEIGGYEVHGAPNGAEGIKMARRVRPDLILCDVKMPEVDGYGVLMDLRSHPSTSDIPFVFLTAFANRDLQRKGMNLGAEDYLTKPFTLEELLETVEFQLQKAETRNKEHEDELERLRQNLMLALPHEMRTPLTGILTCADILKLDFEENMVDLDRIEKMVDIIHNSGIRLQRVIENYLIYSQLDIVANDPKRKINMIYGEGIDTPSHVISAAAGQAAIKSDRADDLYEGILSDAYVQVSDSNLKKIIYELVDNAMKFSKPGEHVHIESQIVDDSYLVRVVDSGRGMTEEQIKQVGAYMQFERKNYEQQGLGLGLVISKRLAKLHRGRVEIESNNGKQGTTVIVEFPIITNKIS